MFLKLHNNTQKKKANLKNVDATPDVITESNKDHKWMPKPLDEKFWKMGYSYVLKVSPQFLLITEACLLN